MNELIKVPFHDTEILAIQDERGEWVVLKPLCQRLGLDDEGQRQRLVRQAWARPGEGTCIMQVPSAGGPQDTFCLHRRRLAMWLATLNINRVRLDVRPYLALLQNEAADVLDDYFNHRGRFARNEAPNRAQVEDVVRALLQEVDPRVQELEAKLASLRELVYALQAPPSPLPDNLPAVIAEEVRKELAKHERTRQPLLQLPLRVPVWSGNLAEKALPMDFSRYVYWVLSAHGYHTRFEGAVPGLVSIPLPGAAALVGRDEAAFLEEFAKLEGAGLAVADWSAPLVWLPHVKRTYGANTPRQVQCWVVHWQGLPECEVKERAACDLWLWMHLLQTYCPPRLGSFVASIERVINRRYALQAREGILHIVPMGLGHTDHARPRPIAEVLAGQHDLIGRLSPLSPALPAHAA